METRTTVVQLPQGLGAFPLPAGYLLVEGDSPALSAARVELAAGRLPDPWPAELEGHRLAHQGAVTEALAVFDRQAAQSPVAAYNRFVLDPDGVDLDRLRAGLPADVAGMVDVVAYAVGRSDAAPQAGPADGEVLALILAARASALLDEGDPASAAGVLHDAVAAAEPVAAPLAGVLLGHAAALVDDHDLVGPEGTDPASALRRALELLDGSHLAVARAELHLHLGLVLHHAAAGGGAGHDSVDQYHAALRLVSRTTSPLTWATANLNLATAYLTMPMVEASDQLRAGIAMASLRAALEVFTQEEHPGQWATAQLNLANALVYTPSTHQGDNLVEAVERYEEVLELRDRSTDPLGRARVLANQGNALAHLGVFDHAKAKLFEARFLFEEHLDHDSAMAVRGLLDEIAKETVPDGAPRAGGLPGVADAAAIRAERASAAAAMTAVPPPMRVVRLDNGGGA